MAAQEAAPEIDAFVAEEGPLLEQETATLVEDAQPALEQLATESGQIVQETISTVEEIGQTIYRNASGTPDSLTPRITQDITNSLTQGKTPGLSFWNSVDKLNPGKYVSVDTTKLKTLDVILDDDPEGHVTLTTTLDKLSDWANTRGTTVIMEQAHKLTQEIWDAAGRVVSTKK